jgi:DNA-directed RNA polymerase subunit M/transcription elongation factor TFIIS
MQFCKECGNILLPKKKKNALYCKVCNKEFPVGKEKDKLETYKKVKKSNAKKSNKRALKTAIVEGEDNGPSISEDERAAYEEYFEMNEMDFSGGGGGGQ